MIHYDPLVLIQCLEQGQCVSHPAVSAAPLKICSDSVVIKLKPACSKSRLCLQGLASLPTENVEGLIKSVKLTRRRTRETETKETAVFNVSVTALIHFHYNREKLIHFDSDQQWIYTLCPNVAPCWGVSTQFRRVLPNRTIQSQAIKTNTDN